MNIETKIDSSRFSVGIISGEPPIIVSLPAHVTLAPVYLKNKNVINPPTFHLGAPIELPLPLEVAELALKYYERVAHEAWELIPNVADPFAPPPF